jgi:hypothetical protein
MFIACSTSRFSPPRPVAGLSAAAAAAVAGVPAVMIAAPTRCQAPVARARQLAVYLHHVALGGSLSACARQFARDRATVRHACGRIEDLRDDPRFDLCAGRLETALAAQQEMVFVLISETLGAPR